MLTTFNGTIGVVRPAESAAGTPADGCYIANAFITIHSKFKLNGRKWLRWWCSFEMVYLLLVGVGIDILRSKPESARIHRPYSPGRKWWAQKCRKPGVGTDTDVTLTARMSFGLFSFLQNISNLKCETTVRMVNSNLYNGRSLRRPDQWNPGNQ